MFGFNWNNQTARDLVQLLGEAVEIFNEGRHAAQAARQGSTPMTTNTHDSSHTINNNTTTTTTTPPRRNGNDNDNDNDNNNDTIHPTKKTGKHNDNKNETLAQSDANNYRIWPNDDLEYTLEEGELDSNLNPYIGWSTIMTNQGKPRKDDGTVRRHYICTGVFVCPEKDCRFVATPTNFKPNTYNGKPSRPKVICPRHPNAILEWDFCKGGHPVRNWTGGRFRFLDLDDHVAAMNGGENIDTVFYECVDLYEEAKPEPEWNKKFACMNRYDNRDAFRIEGEKKTKDAAVALLELGHNSNAEKEAQKKRKAKESDYWSVRKKGNKDKPGSEEEPLRPKRSPQKSGWSVRPEVVGDSGRLVRCTGCGAKIGNDDLAIRYKFELSAGGFGYDHWHCKETCFEDLEGERRELLISKKWPNDRIRTVIENLDDD